MKRDGNDGNPGFPVVVNLVQRFLYNGTFTFDAFKIQCSAKSGNYSTGNV